MGIETIGALAGIQGAGAAAGARSLDQLPRAEAGAAADKFSQALERADSVRAGGVDLPAPLQSIINVLDRVDMQASSVGDYAKQAELSGGTLTPGEIVNLTMRCQEFMFQCQLTSNIANRSSDGVQQLFRQQG